MALIFADPTLGDFVDGDGIDVVKLRPRDRWSKIRRRVVLTWSFPQDAENPERVSHVDFNIQACGNAVRLTVAHSELEPDSPMLHGISRGWPLVLSSLKTMLETGKLLPGTSQRMMRDAVAFQSRRWIE